MRFGRGLLWGEIKGMGVKAFLMHGDVLAVGTVTNLMPSSCLAFDLVV